MWLYQGFLVTSQEMIYTISKVMLNDFLPSCSASTTILISFLFCYCVDRMWSCGSVWHWWEKWSRYRLPEMLRLSCVGILTGQCNAFYNRHSLAVVCFVATFVLSWHGALSKSEPYGNIVFSYSKITVENIVYPSIFINAFHHTYPPSYTLQLN